MGGEKWAAALVSSLCKIYLGGTPRRSEPSYWAGSIKWATAADVASCYTRYLEKVGQTITEKGVAESAARVLPKDTIVITARGTVGSFCMLPEPMAFNQTCYGLVAMERVTAKYFYYALKAVTSQIHSLSYGTVFNTITMKSFDSLNVPVPPLNKQQTIAHILGTLDDKIELNRRMNQTLEAMARAIFKSWFVDFDPVLAKVAGQQPTGLAPHIAELFPDAFVDSGVDEIPRGWTVQNLGDVAMHLRRGVHPSEIDPSTAYIALEHMPKGCIALSDWGIADGLASNKFKFKKGEILFGKLRPYFHKVGVAPVGGVCSTDIVVVTPRAPLRKRKLMR